MLGLGMLAGTAAQTTSPPANIPPAQATPLQSLPPPAPAQVQRPFEVVIDPAHGGSDTGAKLADDVEEKSITLHLSLQLESALQARGIEVETTRQADVDIPEQQRAQTANHVVAAACLILHATATGSGVHLFTSSVGPTLNAQFLPWRTAQSAYVTQSLRLESELNTALAHVAIPTTLGRAAVEPLNHLTCPAVAVEIAPVVAGHSTQGKAVTDPGYEKSVVDALAAAIQAWQSDWKQS